MKAVADGSGNILAIGEAVDGVEITGNVPADWALAIGGKYTLVGTALAENLEWVDPGVAPAVDTPPGWDGMA